MYGFLDQQGGGVACTIKDLCLLPESWWCLDQVCSVIADFCLYSSCGCLVLLQTSLQCPLCFLDVLWPTTAGDLVHHSQCFQCRVSVLDPALARPFIRTALRRGHLCSSMRLTCDSTKSLSQRQCLSWRGTS